MAFNDRPSRLSEQMDQIYGKCFEEERTSSGNGRSTAHFETKRFRLCLKVRVSYQNGHEFAFRKCWRRFGPRSWPNLAQVNFQSCRYKIDQIRWHKHWLCWWIPPLYDFKVPKSALFTRDDHKNDNYKLLGNFWGSAGTITESCGSERELAARFGARRVDHCVVWESEEDEWHWEYHLTGSERI